MKTSLRLAVPSLCALAIVAACSSGPRGGAPPSPNASSAVAPTDSAGSSRCTTSLRGVDVSSWREVSGDGFVVCLPPDWKGRGDTWHRASTTLSWGTGTPPQKKVAYVTREVRRAGEPPTPPEPPAGSDTRQFNERIDGRDAKLFRNRFQGTYYVGADWDSQVTWIRAETTSSDAADLVLNIARTVRFVARQNHPPGEPGR